MPIAMTIQQMVCIPLLAGQMELMPLLEGQIEQMVNVPLLEVQRMENEV